MRILSWNINGIRTLPKYHPWNTFGSCEGILDALEADIICFQEMKSSRAMLPRDVALPGPYHSFFSFPANKGGYSGVAVYTNSRKVTPLKAEEGLSGILQPKPPLLAAERVSPTYPRADEFDMYSGEDDAPPGTLEELDTEGRALVLDFGLFVLINVYCPAETSDARLPYKMNFHLLLQERVRRLIEEEQREVIVLGDINVSATPLDHGDGHLPSTAAVYWDHPPRDWFRKWLAPNGPMVDAIRTFWPERKGMYTCWNTKLQARETNYGARIDYVLVTKGLLPWVKHGDIQPSLKGSDHCPIYIDLHDELVLETGETVKLRDAMRQDQATQLPRLAAKYWDELAGKQTMLSAFFGKRKDPAEEKASEGSSQAEVSALSKSASCTPPVDNTPTESFQDRGPSPAKFKASIAQPRPSTSTKRKPSDKACSSGSNKKSRPEAGQAKIAAFFGKPPTAKSKSKSASKAKEVIVIDEDEDHVPVDGDDSRSRETNSESQIDADYSFACELSTSQIDLVEHSEITSSTAQEDGKRAWSSIFAPVRPPLCTVHKEPTRLLKVNKPGPNKGKTFYACSRPVGPGYDKGRGERLREEVNHEYRCNFFKWASEVKKEARQAKTSDIPR
ncbi:DNase I-like protein [Wolfiporia cocos MD-104 SS10]|uniref:DNA-(apurinic or apyrimidinic site) endonuclease n=1 Tax=Wolfiporia cocos (strain MD-104) TaxID=742152 RepID=A0A2H3J208_WOLCO|nr:DNase I-like protein [Wolfiporia cocos MD-104 SS10]